jgi:hypothetical protein
MDHEIRSFLAMIAIGLVVVLTSRSTWLGRAISDLLRRCDVDPEQRPLDLARPGDLRPPGRGWGGRRGVTFYSNATRKPRVAPGELPFTIGVMAGPIDFTPIGIAYPGGSVGGGGRGPREAVWRLVVVEGPVEGRFALRAGRFVELAEDAE